MFIVVGCAGARRSGSDLVASFTNRSGQLRALARALDLDGACIEIDLDACGRIELLDRAGNRVDAMTATHAIDLEDLVHAVLRSGDKDES
jgi:hypothetical protein